MDFLYLIVGGGAALIIILLLLLLHIEAETRKKAHRAKIIKDHNARMKKLKNK